MSKMSKETKNNKLICITGFVGEGKTTSTLFFASLGCQTFVTDKWIHQIYQKHKKGYQLIVKLFGKQYVNDQEVDRKKLKNLILSNKKAKYLLEKHINKLIYKRINQLKRLNKIVFVELGIYLFHVEFFKDLFSKVIVVDGKNKEKNNDFRKFCAISKFSTKTVGNSKNVDNQGVLEVDFLVENTSDVKNLHSNLNSLFKKII